MPSMTRVKQTTPQDLHLPCPWTDQESGALAREEQSDTYKSGKEPHGFIYNALPELEKKIALLPS